MTGGWKPLDSKNKYSSRELETSENSQPTERIDTTQLWPRSHSQAFGDAAFSDRAFSDNDFGAESSGDKEREANQRKAQVREEDRLLKEEQKSEKLARAIEAEIIPRLLLAHISARTTKAIIEPPLVVESDVFPSEKIAQFSDIVVSQPVNQAVIYIDALLRDGMTKETMILEVLSPTARNLGELWTQDKLTFVEVTLGVSRLQQLLRIYGPAFEVEFAKGQTGHKILLAAMPGEQHTFGMSVVEEFFRRDGWDVHSLADASRKILLQRIKEEWFDVVGLSASGDASVDMLAPLIKVIRETSTNRDLRVIVGGCPFLAEPANAIALGADMVACNGREAVLNVERLLNSAMIQ
jgi:MerR family transcriptional regulator, light-induced transcriptional regulator